MTPYEAVSIAEGFTFDDADDEQMLEAWQYLLDTGLCWALQGWFGRNAMYLIQEGLIAPLPKEES